jgi:hypothetical protein
MYCLLRTLLFALGPLSNVTEPPRLIVLSTVMGSKS